MKEKSWVEKHFLYGRKKKLSSRYNKTGRAGQSFSLGSQWEHASSSSHIIQLQDLSRSAQLFLSHLASFKNCKLTYYWLHNTKIQVFRVIKSKTLLLGLLK